MDFEHGHMELADKLRRGLERAMKKQFAKRDTLYAYWAAYSNGREQGYCLRWGSTAGPRIMGYVCFSEFRCSDELVIYQAVNDLSDMAGNVPSEKAYAEKKFVRIFRNKHWVKDAIDIIIPNIIMHLIGKP